MPTGTAYGAAMERLQRRYGGLFRDDDVTVAVAAAVTPLAVNDGERCFLAIINLGTFPMTVTPNNTCSATKGILLTANGGSFTANEQNDVTIPTREWFGFGVGGATTAYVLTVRRDVVYGLPTEP